MIDYTRVHKITKLHFFQTQGNPEVVNLVQFRLSLSLSLAFFDILGVFCLGNISILTVG